MRISYLRRTDRQTDGEKSALVELRFAAKNLLNDIVHVNRQTEQTILFSCEAQLNKCTFVSVRPSVRLKTEFLTVWSAYESL